MKKTVFILILLSFVFASAEAPALQRGAILYHTSKGDTIYGRTDVLELTCSVLDLALRDMKSGHVGLYIGDNRIIHAVTPTVEETASENFIPQSDLDDGCRYLGAKVPIGFDAWPEEQVDQLILLAREQVGADYDIQFRHQKGPKENGFTCVGLVEYLFEEIGYDITPNGYYSGGAGGRTYTQTYNCEATLGIDWPGDNAFAEGVEFSSFEHPLADLLNVGFLRDGDDNRYMFFPYTQYLQATTVGVPTDITVSGGGDSDDDGGGCFIATAAYGSALHPHLDILREFRDRYMKSNPIGHLFLSVYERYAPSLAGLVERHEVLKSLTRVALLPVLGLCFILLYTGPLPLLALLAAAFIWRFRLAGR
ncbi:MAG TPA: hypothetical protein PLR20_08315 [Syntrophales bacterium]|nr:hypothetical protein [Syntrophales bacterium]HOX94612.1 hypothetical protein [Syntrophales bacterium]HPI58023.1 hypothetical protein [Syntrophales bacterium]HPN25239.1 hypothetical protein [Syntrophales bacterium]HQM29342.1 hypothetical protein [Syntrophales bacterium]